MAELIGGVALAELLRQLVAVSQKGYRCKGVAGNLAIMIGDIQPTIREIQHSGVELSQHRHVQLRIFSETLEKCRKLAEKVLKYKRCDMFRQLYHANKMEGLEKKISSFLKGPLLTHILADVHHLRADSEVRFDRIDRNVDRLISEKFGSMKLRGARLVREAADAMIVTGVGFDLGKKKVKEMMFGLKDKGGLIGISGMSGSGKTTLAREIERDKEVRVHFGDRVLFLTVSQSPNLEDLEASLCRFLTGPTKKLVILDDVWTRGSLDQLMFNVPGTTTLVVSRSKFADPKTTYNVEFLNQDEATSLFCLSAFDQKSVPAGFSQDLVKQVVEECKGLPLSLKVVGASLKNQTEKYWEATLETLDLKAKECFLDMGAFPEDKKIPLDVIINMWVQMHDLEEETAFAILVDLSNKNLLTLVKDPRLGAQYTSYYDIFVTQHDVLRDLALHLSNTGEVNRRERLFMPKRESVLPREWERNNDEPYNARVVSIHTEEMSTMEWFDMELPKAESPLPYVEEIISLRRGYCNIKKRSAGRLASGFMGDLMKSSKEYLAVKMLRNMRTEVQEVKKARASVMMNAVKFAMRAATKLQAVAVYFIHSSPCFRRGS
ncbi:hypothetical protein AALP_AAs65482U000100 [Arabis alpina]|uniref:RPW8 domain-containing protein n=1 Tax=Arabis alpina TaxID=50452 RepID=A0A087G174_ARAAL|nr:hypothetical protein AALP_AAs65482U000100 [Arabis alpina]